MIRHIFKIIWNERRVNGWIMLEYILVFCVLWFCCDFLYYIGKIYWEDPGSDINHTYLIKMGKKDMDPNEMEDKSVYLSLFSERVKRFPGIESLSFSKAAVPNSYANSYNGYRVNEDSAWTTLKYQQVSPGFFDVYKIKCLSGRVFEENDMLTENNIILAPNREGLIGEFGSTTYPIEEIKTVNTRNEKWQVIGICEKTRRSLDEPFRSVLYKALPPDNIDLAYTDISIRVSPDADHNFPQKFVEEMRDQLFIGPYFLISLVPSKEIEKMFIDMYLTDNTNSVLAITGFLLINIFLGLIGTFWFRSQSRRSEIALRIAMGASRWQVKWMMFAEIFIMLFFSSLISIYICINLGETELISSLGVPVAERGQEGIGKEQDFINYILTFAFLAIVSGMAVWYPAKQASEIAPAIALRDK